jgi:proline iminopeptidase
MIRQAPVAREGFAPVDGAEVFYRDIGQGLPIIVLHGGPDFSHSYLLPDLDRLADSCRLIYYDQRGRGRSAAGVRPEDVTIDTEMQDLDRVRRFVQLESVGLLGHSWGGLLAMEYATRYPNRVSHLVLLNTAPASHADVNAFRQDRGRTVSGDMERLKAMAATAPYQTGDVAADAEYYRVHFRSALYRPEHLESVVSRLRIGMTPEGIRKARAIEDRLYAQTWSSSGYDLLPRLARLRIPTLIVHGDHDFVPAACVEHIAEAMPGSRLVMLRDCGHFSYLERPDEVREALKGFLGEH